MGIFTEEQWNVNSVFLTKAVQIKTSKQVQGLVNCSHGMCEMGTQLLPFYALICMVECPFHTRQLLLIFPIPIFHATLVLQA